MAKPDLLIWALFVLLIAPSSCSDANAGDERKIYVVYMGELPEVESPLSLKYHSMLQQVLGSREAAEESIVHRYTRSFSGFAAKLSEDEAKKFSEMEEVVKIFPDKMLELHTTRSWDFIGMPVEQTPRSASEGDVIVGVIDTGVWPESQSFSDEDLGPPPEKWKGICQADDVDNFTCNNKLIGARYYNSIDLYIDEYRSARDVEGHGTHTSSIAAGSKVQGASYFGLAQGIARGGAPKARLAAYKVCWRWSWLPGCAASDILGAFDDAIADGVDVISVSVGSGSAIDYLEDPIAIGAFHAMKRGILTSNSAGNSGPQPGLVSSVAPWSLSVAASTIDRRFISNIVLGNGEMYMGTAVNAFKFNGTFLPLVYGGDVANFSAGSSFVNGRYCYGEGSLDANKVRGKIVYCETLTDTEGVLTAEGGGNIMSSSDEYDYAFAFPVPTTILTKEEGDRVLNYIRSTSTPIATFLDNEVASDIQAPKVVSFSSRGPNDIDGDILKPDISAPGVDILAAWSPLAPSSAYEGDYRAAKYNIVSGTSMSCPHASGAAAYVKSFHPDWSPAAIKSALMTTAFPMNPLTNADAEFAYGSGHINPLKAVHPGLVYDADTKDYIQFLCNHGYNLTAIKLIFGEKNVTCSQSTTIGNTWSLNYPSIALSVKDGSTIYGDFPRVVTNVGPPNSTYTASVAAPFPLTISVEPSTLSFTFEGEKKSFTVKIRGEAVSQQTIISGSIVWEDQSGAYKVRSPIAAYTVNPFTHTPSSLPSQVSSNHFRRFGKKGQTFPIPSLLKTMEKIKLRSKV